MGSRTEVDVEGIARGVFGERFLSVAWNYRPEREMVKLFIFLKGERGFPICSDSELLRDGELLAEEMESWKGRIYGDG